MFVGFSLSVYLLGPGIVQVILAGFRSGRFLVLVATNVAARGLDINDVQLIIQVHFCVPEVVSLITEAHVWS